ncbi:cytochrome c6 isoform A [Thalassiosira oceanica]|uniref:Cytochrome c-553 n=1 Tax=Thalassiosira oceanica TaxID=159749 RepID=K0T3B9_THAOC|nr:cytochrome c6 isoform A [Thalassiosira oceanica]|eukprot:EJK71624.1 cytochrome c6 isoform A [Thalassiosira oceanica]
MRTSTLGSALIVSTVSAWSGEPKFGTFQASVKSAVVGAVGAAVSAGVVVSPASAGDVARGQQIFNMNCAACHAGGQNVIMPEKTLEKDALEKYLSGGRSEASVVTQVTYGKAAMPAFGGRLTDSEISDVASYVIQTSENGWK